MSRPVNPNIPEAGYKSKKQFEDTGSIAASDFAVVSDLDNSRTFTFNSNNLDSGNTCVLQPPPDGGTFTLGTDSVVAGSDTEIQFNSGDVLSASSHFTFDPDTKILTLLTGNTSATDGMIVSSDSYNIPGDGANYFRVIDVSGGGTVFAVGYNIDATAGGENVIYAHNHKLQASKTPRQTSTQLLKNMLTPVLSHQR